MCLSPSRQDRASATAGVLALDMYRAAANSFLVAVMAAEDEEQALTMTQQATILTALIQGLDGFKKDLESSIWIMEQLENAVEVTDLGESI